MKATIIDSILGFFAFDENDRLIEKALFEKNPETVANKILRIENGEAIEELNELVKKLLNSGCDKFVFENPQIAKNIHEAFNAETEATTPSRVGELLRKNTLQFAIDNEFVRTEQEFQEWVHEVSIALTKKRVRKIVEKRDLMVAQAILSIDDLDKTINLFMSRIVEWYGLHFPELTHVLENQETCARLILNLGNRKKLCNRSLRKRRTTPRQGRADKKLRDNIYGR